MPTIKINQTKLVNKRLTELGEEYDRDLKQLHDTYVVALVEDGNSEASVVANLRVEKAQRKAKYMQDKLAIMRGEK